MPASVAPIPMAPPLPLSLPLSPRSCHPSGRWAGPRGGSQGAAGPGTHLPRYTTRHHMATQDSSGTYYKSPYALGWNRYTPNEGTYERQYQPRQAVLVRHFDLKSPAIQTCAGGSS
ncbi:hypothetical protein M406DRAFT_74145 [Cryphonectria parasitica EP155]|uniref:Uncharacterized protein n=1 Tax=Cryphonectria parasitica (strain ATCC 38755 / EP155) TaxID=660469 RepID=A0A9P4XZ52_CRYP1|nr:uncharacterized protein M406DRAFT_74145 [Cryphonectria parasitica EP155]KAF3763553.1 hypothetical protein M406DRAFT_74145 [Cryphonectria parasitica EP155]